jgi:hypothetical protein
MMHRVSLPTGFSRQEFSDEDDVIFIANSAERVGTFQCVGGRNVQHIAGKQVWDWQGGAAERYKDVSTSVFIEGRHIVMKRSGDAFAAGGTHRQSPPFRLFPDVYIQNCRVENVKGSFDGVHADVFQMDYSIGHLRIDRLTAETDYQALFLRPVVPVKGDIDIRRSNFKLNVRHGPQPHTRLLYLFRNGEDVERSRHIIFLTEVYCEIPHGMDPRGFFSPRQGLEIGGDEIGTYLWWPHLTQRIKDDKGRPARIRLGPPPDGDFVKPASVGLGYRSPGYQ